MNNIHSEFQQQQQDINEEAMNRFAAIHRRHSVELEIRLNQHRANRTARAVGTLLGVAIGIAVIMAITKSE